MKEISVIFIGRSGCGKGTQAALLKKYLEKNGGNIPIVYLETGALFREFINGSLYSQKKSREINEAGGLQPEFVTVNLWSGFLIREAKERMHMIIDGSPRKLSEATILDSVFKFYKRSMPHVFYLNVDRIEASRRLLNRGRADDQRKGIRKREDWFESDVVKTIEFYRNNSSYVFHDINGVRSPEEIFKDILAAVV